jgi:hypothetical protein
MEGPDMLGPDMLGPLMLPPAGWAMAPEARSDAVNVTKTIPDRRMKFSLIVGLDLLARLKPRFRYVRLAGV